MMALPEFAWLLLISEEFLNGPRVGSAVRRLPLAGVVTAVLLGLIGLLGCSSEETSRTEPRPFEGVSLTLGVVGSDRLAEAIENAQAGYQRQTGVKLTVVRGTDTTNLPKCDALLYPAAELGPLVERKAIQQWPEEDSGSGSGTGGQRVFTALVEGEAHYGGKPYAVVCGSPVFVCLVRKDWLTEPSTLRPMHWPELPRFALQLVTRQLSQPGSPEASQVVGLLSPLADGWASQVLLTRTAAYARHPDHDSTFFNIQTMQPLIDSPPFVRALEELVAAYQSTEDLLAAAPSSRSGMELDQLRMTPDDVREAFFAGRCAVALTWLLPPEAHPSPVEVDDLPARRADQAAEPIAVATLPVPGSGDVYNYQSKTWQPRETPRSSVPVLSMSGMVGSVSAQTDAPRAAEAVLRWLVDSKGGRSVFRSCAQVTLSRHPQVAEAVLWVDERLTTEDAQGYAGVVAESLSGPLWLDGLRIPGRAEYLAALDDAVQQACRGTATPQEALQQAAQRWQAISVRLGLAQQQAAYVRSVGRQP